MRNDSVTEGQDSSPAPPAFWVSRRVFCRSEGSYLFDERDRKYIDFLSGWNVGNFGWGGKEIKAAIRRSKSPEYVCLYTNFTSAFIVSNPSACE